MYISKTYRHCVIFILFYCTILQVFKQDVPKAINILSDMLTNPKLDEAAIERERGVILRENEEVNQQQVCY